MSCVEHIQASPAELNSSLVALEEAIDEHCTRLLPEERIEKSVELVDNVVCSAGEFVESAHG